MAPVALVLVLVAIVDNWLVWFWAFTTGLLCHLDDACVSNPCNEGAVCDTNPLNGRAICTCPAGFVGGACNQDMDECSIGKSAFFFFTYYHMKSLYLFLECVLYIDHQPSTRRCQSM